MSEPMWKTFGHNDVCSIRRCGAKPTKRVDLAVIGTRRYGAFGERKDWEARSGTVNIAVCDDCCKLLNGETVDEFRCVPMLVKPMTADVEENLRARDFVTFLKKYVRELVKHVGQEDNDS